MSSSSGEGDDRAASGTLAGLWQVIQSIMDESEPAMAAIGLSHKAFFLLDCLGGYPFPAELARRMHLPPPTVTYLIKQLEARGFLERRSESVDLRKFRLLPTPAGVEALEKGREILGGCLADRLRRLEPEEVAALDRIVGRLAAAPEDGG